MIYDFRWRRIQPRANHQSSIENQKSVWSVVSPVILADDVAVLVEMDVVTLVALERPEVDRDEHDYSAKQRQAEFEVDARRRIRIERADRDRADQEACAGDQ